MKKMQAGWYNKTEKKSLYIFIKEAYSKVIIFISHPQDLLDKDSKVTKHNNQCRIFLCVL